MNDDDDDVTPIVPGLCLLLFAFPAPVKRSQAPTPIKFAHLLWTLCSRPRRVLKVSPSHFSTVMILRCAPGQELRFAADNIAQVPFLRLGALIFAPSSTLKKPVLTLPSPGGASPVTCISVLS